MYQYEKNTGRYPRKKFWIVLAFSACFLLFFSPPGTAASPAGTSFMKWGSIKVSYTHVRKNPSKKSPSLEILRKGQLVLLNSKKGGWSQVTYEYGKSGWIFSGNIAEGIPKKPAGANRILAIKDTLKGKAGQIEFYFNGILSEIVAFTLQSPPRIVFDVSSFKIPKNEKFLLSAKQPLIEKVYAGVHPGKTRFVVGLKKGIQKFAFSKPDSLNKVMFVVTTGKGKTAPPKRQNVSAAGLKKKKTGQPHVSTAKKAEYVRISKTGFKDKAKESSISLSVSRKPDYYVKLSKGKMGLILNGAVIDKRYTRFMDTSRFNTPVKKIEFKNLKNSKKGKKAEVWVTVDKIVPYDVIVSTHTLKWVFQKPESYLKKPVKVKTVKKVSPKKKLPPTSAIKKKHASAAAAPAKGNIRIITPTSSEKLRPKYTGKKMTFDFQGADVHNVLRIIAEVSNLNIVAGDDVRGKITLRLKNVPWDQALDIILDSRGLGKQVIGNVLRIAPKAVLKKEVQEKVATRKVVEKLESRATDYIPVNYTTAKDLAAKIKPIMSKRGTVTTDERTNTLIVKDIPKKIKEIKVLVKHLDTPTPEVLIESRIVEAAKEFVREFGIKWGMTYNADPSHGNAPSSNFPNAMNVRGGASGQTGGASTGGGGTTAAGLLPLVNLPATASYGAIGVSLEQIVDIFKLDVELTAMEDNGQGKVISSPRVATLDNKLAKIQQGLKIPYLKITEEGTVTTEFIEANLNLEVTPHVSNDKMVNMEIKVAKDTPDWSHLVQGVPSIDKKEAETNVMVRDGGVTVIGGIFTIEKTNAIHKVPLFGDIPILGWAFKNKRVVKNRKELLIFISPKLIPLK